MMSNIPKPEGATWTDEQWQAITATGKDILVAAAAGSGKTAVLVERIIKKITSKENPTDVDRLLIATFTNAAAAEMRKRIGDALEKELAERPASLHLRRQLSLLNRASISTLHSFCMNIARKYYYKIDLDPGFRIADETEGQLLMDEVLDDLFEEQYGIEDNAAFYDLVDRYTGDRSDSELQEMIRKLYDFSRSHPWPDHWLDETVASYRLNGIDTIDDLPWISELYTDIRIQLTGMLSILETALEITRQPGGPSPYAENIESDMVIIKGLLDAAKTDWHTLYEAMQSFSFSKLKACRGKDVNSDLQDQVKTMRDKVKKQLQSIKDELFSRTPEAFLDDLKEMGPVVETLVGLVKEFGRRYTEVKKEKGLVDFTDLEHYALAILRSEDSTPEQLIPSSAALDYREQFVEVLVDEYQDTNHVQESILQLVTKDSDVAGNMFMVGDVKQSIYRFRLAEPGLFLGKYKLFSTEAEAEGWRIDLARNFRSRSEVLDGTNYLFKQIMNETVGEIEYDEQAELKLGATYPDSEETRAELILIDRDEETGESAAEQEDEEEETKEEAVMLDPSELETVQLEARMMAKKIKAMIGDGTEKPFQVYDRKLDGTRAVTYRDIVILLRSMPWAPTIMEELKQQGIPVYAELSSGYFEAIEVSIMISLLKVIDNPYQDIPLASVLRSPIIGLTEEEMAKIRIADKHGSYYEALQRFLQQNEQDGLFKKLSVFYHQLQNWRTEARSGALSDLIWRVYGETGYYDFVGGMPGGKQRQANLRALYDRARQYEATSFRGLFRFLRFVERMQDRGDDLGAARALGEQEDVVRIMTIHKSKGLEFPVVFVAGLARQFNTRDLKEKVLLHKELGFASKLIDPKLRISYPTLPQLTMKRRMRMEMIAEEMRVLYVALTRAKEKLFLLGTVKSAQKTLKDWEKHLANKGWLLPDYERIQSKSYLDWVGPALVRHKDAGALRSEADGLDVHPELFDHPSKWEVEIVKSRDLTEIPVEQLEQDQAFIEAVREWQPADSDETFQQKIEMNLTWAYPYEAAYTHKSKQSVTELKRQRQALDEASDTELLGRFSGPIEDRPKFLQKKSMTAAERGTAMHAVMQHLDWKSGVTDQAIREQVSRMVQKELLTEEQAAVIDIDSISAFFESDIGKRMMGADVVEREVPFSLAVPAKEAYSDWNGNDEEIILVQGVIDCIMEDEGGLVLIDYKTDNISERFGGDFTKARPVLAGRYKVQLEIYQQALERIFKRPVAEKYLYFFDGNHFLKMD